MKKRAPILWSLARGLLVSIGVTLAGMLALAGAILGFGMEESTLTLCNQMLKLLAILLGVRAAVGRGGSRGFATGMALAALYMILGYAAYCLLGGMPFSPGEMMLEIIVGAFVGALTGMLFANLRPRRKAPRMNRKAA